MHIFGEDNGKQLRPLKPVILYGPDGKRVISDPMDGFMRWWSKLVNIPRPYIKLD